MPIKNRIAEMQEEITAWRRDFHEHPEVMFDVHRTAGVVAAKLREFGCDEVVEGIGQTGVVGVIKGQSTASGRVIALRADMDALPMTEITGLPYASKTKGAMHACGHDGHTAMLLGAAKYFTETRNFDGTVVLLFQPAEEGGAGGLKMVEDGAMDRWNVQEVYGLHNYPGLPVGEFAIRPGALMASADQFEVTVTGKGGHAAEPHQSVDTTLATAQIVVALQSVVARNVQAIRPAVLSITAFHTESDTFNVIPQTARIRGTVRCFDAKTRDLVEARLREMVDLTARSFGATASVDYERGYPPTVNHADQTRYAIEAAEAVGTKVNPETDPVMPAEDFSYMLEARPGAYIFLGNGDTPMCHHPAYDFTDEAAPYGTSFFAELIERRLPR
ncbi:MAG: amidohydrolase [Rhodobacteraceae bacterium]|nr:amidohydrolase [Paracoccaceae bacterium]